MTADPDGWPFGERLDLDRIEAAPKLAAMGAIYRHIQDDWMKQFFKEVWPRSPYDKNISLGFTPDLQFGARAAHAKGAIKYAVAIDGLTWPQLFAVVTRLLAHPETLPGYSGQLPPRPSQKYALPIFLPSGPRLLFDGETVEPPPLEDKIRSECLHQIFMDAVLFIILHEAAHVAGGHLEYLNDARKRWDTIKHIPKKQQEYRDIEHVADAWALTMGMELFSRRSENLEAKQFYFLGFSVAVIFLLIEQMECLAGAEHSLNTHPPASHRLFFCKAVSQGWASAGEGISRNVLAGMEDAEAAWHVMGWRVNSSQLDSIDFMLRPLELYQQLAMRDPSSGIFD